MSSSSYQKAPKKAKRGGEGAIKANILFHMNNDYEFNTTDGSVPKQLMEYLKKKGKTERWLKRTVLHWKSENGFPAAIPRKVVEKLIKKSKCKTLLQKILPLVNHNNLCVGAKDHDEDEGYLMYQYSYYKHPTAEYLALEEKYPQYNQQRNQLHKLFLDNNLYVLVAEKIAEFLKDDKRKMDSFNALFNDRLPTECFINLYDVFEDMQIKTGFASHRDRIAYASAILSLTSDRDESSCLAIEDSSGELVPTPLKAGELVIFSRCMHKVLGQTRSEMRLTIIFFY